MIETSPCIENIEGDKYRCRNTGVEFRTTQLPIVCPCSDPPVRREVATGSRQGPGTELKKMLGRFRIYPNGRCKCRERMAIMDTKGSDWCDDNIDTIVGWLREEAKQRKMPFIRYAARQIIRRAIRKARLHELGNSNNNRSTV